MCKKTENAEMVRIDRSTTNTQRNMHSHEKDQEDQNQQKKNSNTRMSVPLQHRSHCLQVVEVNAVR